MAQADLKVKPFPPVKNAQRPKRMTEGAAGFDFYAEEIIHEDESSIWYRTGFGVNIPNHFFGDLRARSSVSEMGLVLANGAGVIDSDYQGEVQFRFYKNQSDRRFLKKNRQFGLQNPDWEDEEYQHRRRVDVYEPGDRIGQLIIVAEYTSQHTGVEVVENFEEETERGEGGFGSTNE